MSAPTSAIESVLVENRVFPPSDAIVKAARVSGMAGYEALCAEAEKDFAGSCVLSVQTQRQFRRIVAVHHAGRFLGLCVREGVRGMCA